MATYIDVQPESYTFPDVGSTTTLNVETDASVVKFVKVGDYGDGLATYNHVTRELTATRYGRALYEFRIDGDDGEIISIPYVIEVSRQIVSDREIELYVPLEDNVLLEYEPPTGYYYKHTEIIADDFSAVEVDNAGTPQFRGIALGSTRCRIILGKLPAEIEDDDGEYSYDFEQEDSDIEYIGGYVNTKVFVLNLEPYNSDISLLKDKEYQIEFLSIELEDGITLPIQFDLEFDSNNPAFSIDTTKLPNSTGGNEYMVDITTLEEGTGIIKLNVDGEIVHTISIEVEDRKIVTVKPDTDEITLGFNKSYSFTEVTYENNEVLDDIEVLVPAGSPFSAVKMLANPDVPNVFTVNVTNTSSEGGSGSFIIKGIDTSKNQKTIKINCFKEVIPGEIETRPFNQSLRIVQSAAYEYDYILATNCEFITVESENNDICTPIVDPLTDMITELDDEGNTVIKEWPEGSIRKKLYLVCPELGTTFINIKSYVNDDDLVASLRIKIEVSEVDTLPDYSSIINLKTRPFPKGRKKDILIQAPEKSSVLVLKQDLQDNLNLEFGYSYDYIEEGNPTEKTNPTTKSSSTGKPTWLNVLTGEGFTCLVKDRNYNVWKGNKGTWIGKKVYPEPGHFNFGKGVASESLLERYKLTKLENSNNLDHPDYGIYVGDDNNRYAFIPTHCIIPIKDVNLLGVYPYYGVYYKFSYEQSGEFTRNTIPRCFINNNKVQEGIFVSITDGTVSTGSKDATSAKHSITSLPSVYKTLGNSGYKYDSFKEYSSTDKYPELREMQQVYRVYDTATPSIGRHNMTIFIQNMLANLADLQIIACHEQKINNSHIENGLSTPNTASWTTTNFLYNPVDKSGLVSNEYIVKEKKNGVYGPHSLDINRKYLNTYSLTGNEGSIFHINGPINMPLPGVMVKVSSNDPNTYEVYTLKESVDVAAVEQEALLTIGTSNVDNLIFRTGLFDTAYYDIVCTLTGEEFKGIRYINKDDPMSTHNVNGVSMLELPDSSGRIGLNIGVDLYGLKVKDFTKYTDKPTNTGKWRNDAFYIGNVADSTELHSEDRTWYGFFTCNYAMNNNEYYYSNVKNNEVRTNGTRTRILNFIGSKYYTGLNGSIYPLTHRICITPNV